MERAAGVLLSLLLMTVISGGFAGEALVKPREEAGSSMSLHKNQPYPFQYSFYPHNIFL
jgi:hypothetical protein